jgi:UDP-N-acetylglucosamine:LPS N-acetylglucosamine transferase
VWRLRFSGKQNRTHSIRVLAVSSGGGHWIELLRLAPAFEDCTLIYATVSRDYRPMVQGHRFHVVGDGTRWNKLALLSVALRVLTVLLWERPHVVVSTGAAPGYLALRLGKLLGARTIWVDSIANAEELSLSGQKAGAIADLWLTQWEHLARPSGPEYAGAVL